MARCAPAYAMVKGTQRVFRRTLHVCLSPGRTPANLAHGHRIPSGHQAQRHTCRLRPSKISIAVTKAFLAVEGDTAAGSARINDAVHRVTDQVIQAISRRLKAGGKVHIEDIQDQVELALMRAEEQKVARAYVLYREEHARERARHAPVEAHPI